MTRVCKARNKKAKCLSNEDYLIPRLSKNRYKASDFTRWSIYKTMMLQNSQDRENRVWSKYD